MCLQPKWIFKKGERKETTFRGVVGEHYEIGMYAKCGHCSQCTAEKSNNWVVRNYYEEKQHKQKCFLTLTYNEENNPIVLRRKDLQNFIKRLRYYLNKDGIKIRYFGCGEYGELRGRPHYHLIIYGWAPSDQKYLELSKRNNICMTSKFIEKVWGMGRITVQEFNQAEIAYISLYNTNKHECKKSIRAKREALKKAYLNRKKGANKKQEERIRELIQDLKKSEKEWAEIKEFNCWSLSTGWKEFEKSYDEGKEQEFKHYIGKATLGTPTPWLKKLANKWGEQKAIIEIKRREEIAKADGNELNEIQLLIKGNKLINHAKDVLELQRHKKDYREGSTNL